MENHRCEQIYEVLLSMNISCCERCPNILRKKLLRMPGVDTFSIEVEKDLIKVSGTMEPETLLNNVRKLGKRVKLVPMEELNKRQKHTPRYQESPRGKRVLEEKEVKEPHRCEAYEPPKIDERVCRDILCKIHPRSRPMVDKLSAQGASLPFYAGFGPFFNDPSMSYGGYQQPYPQQLVQPQQFWHPY